MKHSEIFEFVSIETLIHKEQKKYYAILEACDRAGDSTQFIEFSLRIINDALLEFQTLHRPSRVTYQERIEHALEIFKEQEFTRKDYMEIHKGISTATASRDLAQAVSEGFLQRKGERARTTYKFIIHSMPRHL